MGISSSKEANLKFPTVAECCWGRELLDDPTVIQTAHKSSCHASSRLSSSILMRESGDILAPPIGSNNQEMGYTWQLPKPLDPNHLFLSPPSPTNCAPRSPVRALGSPPRSPIARSSGVSTPKSSGIASLKDEELDLTPSLPVENPSTMQILLDVTLPPLVYSSSEESFLPPLNAILPEGNEPSPLFSEKAIFTVPAEVVPLLPSEPSSLLIVDNLTDVSPICSQSSEKTDISVISDVTPTIPLVPSVNKASSSQTSSSQTSTKSISGIPTTSHAKENPNGEIANKRRRHKPTPTATPTPTPEKLPTRSVRQQRSKPPPSSIATPHTVPFIPSSTVISNYKEGELRAMVQSVQRRQINATPSASSRPAITIRPTTRNVSRRSERIK